MSPSGHQTWLAGNPLEMGVLLGKNIEKWAIFQLATVDYRRVTGDLGLDIAPAPVNGSSTI